MTKPKGSRNRATLEKQKRAPVLLEQYSAARAHLRDELQVTENRIREEQEKAREIRKRLRRLDREIEAQEKAKAELEAREKAAADMEKISAAVETLVASGMSAEEIIQRLG